MADNGNWIVMTEAICKKHLSQQQEFYRDSKKLPSEFMIMLGSLDLRKALEDRFPEELADDLKTSVEESLQEIAFRVALIYITSHAITDKIR